MQRDLEKYPRRVFKRKIIRGVGRFVIRTLTDFTLEGEENFPKTGAYIMAGNHVSAMEVILMALFAPKQVEILGAGDIPLDPNLAPFANLHGYIPINRGSVDQKALNTAANVLKNGGLVGIFPEGGIWNKSLAAAKLGVGWLSFRNKSDVLPIGFIGMAGALTKMLHFQRPKITMRVGKLMPFDALFPSGTDLSKKELMQVAADSIMFGIKNLLPEEEQEGHKADDLKTLELRFEYFENEKVRKMEFSNQTELSRVLTHPVIMDVFRRNLKLPVRALDTFGKPVSTKSMIRGIQSISDYLREHDSFLIYRFGNETGRAMESGINNYLDTLKQLYAENKLSVQITELK